MSGHTALVYRGMDQFLTGVGRFVRDGLAADDRVMVLVSAAKMERLHAVLGDDAGRVDLASSDDAYRPQARSIHLAREYLREQPGRRTRMVAEQDLTRRGPLEVEAYMRQEASANVVYEGFPVSILCAYDAAGVPETVLSSCRQTHSSVLVDHRVEPNAQYVDPRTFLAGLRPSQPPVDAEMLVCDGVNDLVVARALVQRHAREAGFGPDPTQDLVLAANEVLTNALTHGLPPARLHLYTDGPALVCHVHDTGGGVADPLVGYLPPVEGAGGGRGLWLARQLCDAVEVARDASGSHVRLLMLLDRR